MTIRIRNTDTSAHTWSGQTIAANGFYDILEVELQGFKDSGNVFTAVASGQAVISDGTNDFTSVVGWDYLCGNLPTQVELPKISPLSGRPEVVVIEAEGDGDSLPSHDFTDKTTWWQESARIMNETPTLISGKNYSLANTYIIDCTHGKITFEIELNMMNSIIVKDNGMMLTNDTDFTVDYVAGEITFDAGYTITGPLLVTYSYATNSNFTLVPEVGKRCRISNAEIQFTKDLVMVPIKFEILAYNPADLPNKVVVFTKIYKNIKDIIAVARQGTGYIPAIAPFSQDILVFPFHYSPVIALNSSQGMELRVSTVGDVPMTGEWGMMTFYITTEDE